MPDPAPVDKITGCLGARRGRSRGGSAGTFSRGAAPCRPNPETPGESRTFTRSGDSGNPVTLHFCASCGSTVYWELQAVPGFLAVAVGAFADPQFPQSWISVYEERRHPWVAIEPTGPIERID